LARNILFLIGILSLGYYGYVSVDAKVFQSVQRRQFEQAVSQPRIEVPAVELPSATPSNHPAPERAEPFTMPVAGGPVLGKLEIEKVGLTVVIVEGTDDRALRRGVGHIPESALPGESGNVGIAGHRDTFFRDLRKVEKSDEIKLETANGLFRYAVDFSEVVDPTDTQVLDASSTPTLTLVTCYPFWYVGPAPKRLIVRAYLIPQ
jgi:sortase A